MSLVDVESLRVELTATGDDIVDDVSFSIETGEVLGLVGESGSGKTTVGTALLGYARRGAKLAGGQVRIDGGDILALAANELRDRRGKLVAYVPQDPAAALNPALRIRRQLEETLLAHGIGADANDRRARLRQVLAEVQLPATDEFLSRFPHQLSGGQQQRVCIAIAFACRPRVIVLDEPTTGLDVTTQAHVLETVRDLCARHGVAALYVTHDLAVVANLAHRVLVMYAGRLAEFGPRAKVFDRPAHPYTSRLLAAIPDVGGRRLLEAIPGQAPPPGTRPQGCAFAPRCTFAIDACRDAAPPAIEVEAGHVSRCLRAAQIAGDRRRLALVAPAEAPDRSDPVLTVEHVHASYGKEEVLHGVSVELRPRECLALVGESGSGKTTLARTVIGLTTNCSGEIRFHGQLLPTKARDRPAEVRRSLQYIFQSPYNSLNPRQTIRQIVAVPLEHFFGLKGRNADARVIEALDRVALSPGIAARYPDQLSGGERQRVAIARALVCGPEVLICDEITSALDVSVQAAIVQLLEQLQEQEQLSMLFVTHNLALVRTIADRIAVIRDGRIVETGPTADVLDRPREAYTRELLADTPRIALRRSEREAKSTRPHFSEGRLG